MPLSFCLLVGPLGRSCSAVRTAAPSTAILPPSLVTGLGPSSVTVRFVGSAIVIALSPNVAVSVPSNGLRTPMASIILG